MFVCVCAYLYVPRKYQHHYSSACTLYSRRHTFHIIQKATPWDHNLCTSVLENLIYLSAFTENMFLDLNFYCYSTYQCNVFTYFLMFLISNMPKELQLRPVFQKLEFPFGLRPHAVSQNVTDMRLNCVTGRHFLVFFSWRWPHLDMHAWHDLHKGVI